MASLYRLGFYDVADPEQRPVLVHGRTYRVKQGSMLHLAAAFEEHIRRVLDKGQGWRGEKLYQVSQDDIEVVIMPGGEFYRPELNAKDDDDNDDALPENPIWKEREAEAKRLTELLGLEVSFDPKREYTDDPQSKGNIFRVWTRDLIDPSEWLDLREGPPCIELAYSLRWNAGVLMDKAAEVAKHDGYDFGKYRITLYGVWQGKTLLHRSTSLEGARGFAKMTQKLNPDAEIRLEQAEHWLARCGDAEKLPIDETAEATPAVVSVEPEAPATVEADACACVA